MSNSNLKLNSEDLYLSSSDSYDAEYYRDEKDYERLNRMPELEREKIIFLRSERRRKHKERKAAKKDMFKGSYEIAKRIKNKKKKRIERSKKNFMNNESETMEEIEKALKFLRSEKEMKEKANYQDTKDKVDLDTIKKCYIRRDALAKICNEPYLDEYIKGMFVKISTGMDDMGNSKYVLAQIEDTKIHSKKYRFSSGITNKALLLKVGLSTKVCRFDLISNSSISIIEFEEWLQTLESAEKHKVQWFSYKLSVKNAAGLQYNRKLFIKDLAKEWLLITEVPSKSDLLSKIKKAEHLRTNYVYTASDFNKMAGNADEGPIKNVGNITRELIELKGKIDYAKMKGNVKEHSELLRREKFLLNFQNRRSSVDESEKIIQRMTKTWDEFSATKSGKNLDAFKRTNTRSFVQRFGAENQRKEFKKMEKKITILRELRTSEMKVGQENASRSEEFIARRWKEAFVEAVNKNNSINVSSTKGSFRVGGDSDNKVVDETNEKKEKSELSSCDEVVKFEDAVYNKDPMHEFFNHALIGVELDFD